MKQEEAVMPVQGTLLEPGRVDEPRAAEEYSDVLTQVASDHRPVIVRRNGADLAAVVPLEHLELLQDLLARQEAERMAAQLDWDRLVKTSPPPQAWFDGDEPKPF
jgi:prevent-host-death family protein